MKTTTLFISETTLKTKGFIGENVDFKVLKPIIFSVQDTELHDILGTALLHEIDNRVAANTIITSSAYTTLMQNYIEPCLLWYVQCEVQLFNTFKMANKGLLTKGAENIQTASMSDLIRVEERMRDRGQVYAQRLTDYLKANTDTFPKYLDQSTEGLNARYPNNSSFSTGMYLGDADDDCKDYWYTRP